LLDGITSLGRSLDEGSGRRNDVVLAVAFCTPTREMPPMRSAIA